MKILKKSVGEAWTQSEQIAACIGYFDGLHIGHMGLVRNVVQLAAQTGLTPALITFDPDPWVTLRGMHELMAEFEVQVVGTGVVVQTEKPVKKIILSY